MSIKQQIEQILGSHNTDRRIPVVVLLGATPEHVGAYILRDFSGVDLSGLVVFGKGQTPSAWPDGLRFRGTEIDELIGSQSCICCAMRSELASSLSQLFLAVLRKQEQPVEAVLLFTQAMDASALVASLKHAPFLAQRYRLALSLPLTGA